MALSFEESKKQLAKQMATPAVMSLSVPNSGIMTLDAVDENVAIAAYSGEDGSWTEHTGYVRYSAFSDDNISQIDDKKTIVLNENQFNITQEENSQYIPFEMPRHYDGFDLVNATISIHYETKSGAHGRSKPVNVTYNNNKIRFGWLIDANATRDAGILKFEIHAYGSVIGSDGKELGYVWKTKHNENLNVLQSLCDCKEVVNKIDADNSWVTELVTDIAESVAEQIANAQVGAQVAAAENAANRAEISASNAASAAQNVVTNALSGYSTTAQMEEYVAGQIANADIEGKLTAYAKTEDVNALIGDMGDKDNVVDYVNDAVASVDVTEQLVDYALKSELPVVPENVSAFTNDAGYLTEHQSLEGLATEEYVKEAIETVNISEQLGDLGINEDGSEKTVRQYVDDAIADVDLSNYYTKDATYNKTEIDDKIANVKVDLSDYATTDDLNAVRQNTVTNATNIATVQNDIAAIRSSLSSFEGDNKNLIIQYDEVGSVLHLYEKNENGDITITDGDEQIRVKEIYSTVITGAGGGGGSSLVSTIKLSLRVDGEDSFTILHGSAFSLNYNLSTRKAKEIQDEDGNDVTIYEESVIPGDITFTLYRDNVYLTHFTVTKTSSEVQSGSVDISDYISLGDQVFTITASYVEKLGSDGETITVRSSEDWAITAVKLGITNLPDSTWETTPKYGSTTFSYTPIGALEKTIYFQIDEEEPEIVVTSLDGTALSYTIPQQTHGVHTLKVWCEGNVGGTVIPTEPYKYVLMFVEDGNEKPIIRIKAPETLEQYSSDYIYYNVLDPLNPIIDSVVIYDEDGMILSSVENITSAERKYEFRPSVVKDKTITIKYKEITESVAIEVTRFPYEINAVTGDLMVDFVPTGRTNSDADYNVFKNNAYTVEKDKDTGEETQKEIPMTWTFSDNFDWVNGGWKNDENNDTYFCVKAGTSVDINYNLFGTDGVVAKKDANGEFTIAGTGKEFKLIFKTTNVAQANATWLQCVDVADKKSLGLRMEAQNAYIDSGLGTLEIPYVDNDIIEFDMNIVPMTKFLDDGAPNLKVKAIPMIITYEDGTPVQPKVISSASTSFKQDTPKPITIGSEYCDVHIYRMKVYERYLDDKEIITNFIADARSGVEMAKRYVRNDIYPIDDKQKITPESVAAACPDLKVYVLSAPYFTNDKGNKVANTTIRQIHNTGTKENPEYDASENWTATGATHNGQGTSSNEYGYSGRNLEFNLKKATITLNDNVTVVDKIQLSPTSYPTNYLNFKINIASSENANNALLQKRYDRYLPYTSVASLIDDRKKNSMEFFNCVVFIQETDTTLANHREFNDTDIHFYGIGNIGDSKKTDDTRVNDVDDVNEFCVEIMDWNRYLSSFPTDTMVSTLYTDDDGTQVLRFEDFLVDTNLGENGIIYEKDDQGKYYHSTDATIDKTKTYYIDILENDDFSEDYTYGFRYVQSEWDKDDGDDYKEKNEAFQKPLRQKWIEFYRFVTRDLTTNGVEDTDKVAAWKAEFSNWFITDSAFYYYLYTLRYTMVDNRAKNTFWHWSKHYLTFEEATSRGIALYDEDENLITDTSNLPTRFYDINGKEIKNINAAAAAINDGYRMEFWAYDNDTALGIDNAGKLEIPIGVEEDDVDAAGVPYFRAHDSLVFARIAKYFVDELEMMWHNTENPDIRLPEGVGQKVFDSTSFISEFDEWQNEFPEELWRLDYERKYKRTYVGGTGDDWDNALTQSNKSDIVSTRFLTEMMNGRKKYQRRCFERNQEIYMSSKFKGEVNLGDTITLRGTGRPTGKVVSFSSTLHIVPFSKMYVNLYSATDKIYYHEKHEAGENLAIPYPETSLDFIYVRGASQVQSLGDLSPMYLQTAELTSGTKLKTIKLGNDTDGYSNDSLKELQIGAGNKLLEELDIRNLSNLNNTVLPVSNIQSLKRVYAQGSNISEAKFANNGLLEEAYLPETLTRLELRNLHYLKAINLESYNNLLHLVVMDCSTHNDSDINISDLIIDMINQATDLKTLRVNNIDWTLDDTTVLEGLYSLIKDFKNPEVVLDGTVHLTQIKEYDKKRYEDIWSKLVIDVPTTGIIRQYPVTFINSDGTPLLNANGTPMVQYVTVNEKAIDPSVKDDGGNYTFPTIASDVEYHYTFSGQWVYANTAKVFDFTTPIRSDITLQATYTPERRSYEVKYVTKTQTFTMSGLYGSNVSYDYDTYGIPSYIGEENANTFYLFSHWDKSGYVDGNKIINAVFDSCTYEEGYFDREDKKISMLRPVELYMMTKLGLVEDYISSGDELIMPFGSDFNYDDITGDKVNEIISSPRTFTGASGDYFNTGINLFEEDHSFVLAIEYNVTAGDTIAQCYSNDQFGDGQRGFRIRKSDSNITFGIGSNAAENISNTNSREIVVIRHIEGENGLHVYSSSTRDDSIIYKEFVSSDGIMHDRPLVFGCSLDNGDNPSLYSAGTVYWAKVWHVDLGDSVCRELACWPHETLKFTACYEAVDEFGNQNAKTYVLNGDGSYKKSSISFIASNVLTAPKKYNNKAANYNTGGWAASDLRDYLNKRIYNAIPIQWRQLLKEVMIASTEGNGSSVITNSECYIFIPSISEVHPTMQSVAPYNNEGSIISHMADPDTDFRKCYDVSGNAVEYWTRSPNIGSSKIYIYTVDADGYADGINSVSYELYVRIMFTI